MKKTILPDQAKLLSPALKILAHISILKQFSNYPQESRAHVLWMRSLQKLSP